jgi:WD40 repeat protein
MSYKTVLTCWVILMSVFAGMVLPSGTTAQTDDRNVPTVISSVKWEPNGERILVTGRGQPEHWAVWLYDAQATQSPVEVLSYEEPVSVHWSPDGSRFSVGHNIVDAQTLDITLTLNDAASGIGGWSPDGTQVLAWADDTQLGLFDTTTGRLVRTVSVGDEKPDAVGWSPNGEYLALVQPTGDTDIISADDGRHITTIPMEYPMGLRWSPDSRYLAAGFTENVEPGTPGTLPDAASPRVASVMVWETLTGKVVRRFDGLLDWAAVIRWHPQQPEIAAGTPIGLV